MIDEQIEMHKKALRAGRSSIFLAIIFTFIALAPLIFSIYRNENAWLILLVIAFLTLLPFAILLSRSKWIIIKAARATPVAREYQRELEGLAEEVSLASGLKYPALGYIDSDFRNAFSIKWRKRGAVFLSRGLVEALSRDETRTVIAHEMAKINCVYHSRHNFKLALRALPALLKRKLGERTGLIAFPILVLLFIIYILVVIPMVIYIFAKDGIIIGPFYLAVAIYTALMIRAYLSNKIARMHALYYLADELATVWTMQPEALVDALNKTEQYHLSQEFEFIEKVSFVPISFTASESPMPVSGPAFLSVLRDRLMNASVQSLQKLSNPSVEMRLDNLRKSLKPLLGPE
jgi:Zn-dependent protease with chaperone function